MSFVQLALNVSALGATQDSVSFVVLHMLLCPVGLAFKAMHSKAYVLYRNIDQNLVSMKIGHMSFL